MKKSTKTESSGKSKRGKKIRTGIPARLTACCGPLFVGIDVHKRSFRICIIDKNEKKIAEWTQASSSKALIVTLKPVEEKIQDIFYEAGPTGYNLWRALYRAGFPCTVIAPSKVPSISTPHPKNDSLDAFNLASYGSKGLLSSVAVPTVEEEGEREILRLRESITKDLRTAKNRIAMFLLKYDLPDPRSGSCWSKRAIEELKLMISSDRHNSDVMFSLGIMIDHLEYLMEKKKEAASRQENVCSRKHNIENYERLKAVEGVGPVTAATFLLELFRPERFRNTRCVSRYMGLAPQVYQTGETLRGGPILKSGNTRMRSVLIQAAWRWVVLDPLAQEVFSRIANRTGSKKKAVVAMARKLGIVLWKIMTTGEDYRGEAA